MPRVLPLFAASAALALLPSCACGNFFDYFSTVSGNALFLGVDDPVEGIDLGEAAAVQVFLAEANDLSEVEANLFDDADSVVFGGVDVPNQGSGLYQATSGESALTYQVGASYTLTVTDGGETFQATGTAPAGAQLSGLPAAGSHPAGAELRLDLSGQGFDNYVAVVADENGDLTYDSRPSSAGDYVDWIVGTDVGTVVIPGSAFPNPGRAYVLGIAGVERAEDNAFEGFNPIASNLALGVLRVEPIVTAP